MIGSLALLGLAACAPRPGARVPGSGPCTYAPAPGLSCGPCADGPVRSVTASDALVRQTLAALLIAEGQRGLLTNLDAHGGSTRFYRTSDGRPLDLPAGAPRFARDLAALDDHARTHPFAPVFLIAIEVVGVGFDGHVFVRATVTDHAWLDDRGVFIDEVVPAEYCVQRRGDRLEIHVVSPPMHLG